MLIEDFYHDAGLDWSVATSALLRKNRLKRAQIVLAHPEGGGAGRIFKSQQPRQAAEHLS